MLLMLDAGAWGTGARAYVSMPLRKAPPQSRDVMDV